MVTDNSFVLNPNSRMRASSLRIVGTYHSDEHGTVVNVQGTTNKFQYYFMRIFIVFFFVLPNAVIIPNMDQFDLRTLIMVNLFCCLSLLQIPIDKYFRKQLLKRFLDELEIKDPSRRL